MRRCLRSAVSGVLLVDILVGLLCSVCVVCVCGGHLCKEGGGVVSIVVLVYFLTGSSIDMYVYSTVRYETSTVPGQV